jgi:excisionase family DNA binding protein
LLAFFVQNVHIESMTKLLTSTKAAALLRVSVSTVKRWADDGTLPSELTRGGHRRFTRADLDRFRTSRPSVSPAPEDKAESWLDLLLRVPTPHLVAGRLLASRGMLGAWASATEDLARALEQLGVLWRRGGVSIATEHRVTENVSRGISLCLASLPDSPDGPCAVLATAEGDEHVLGLSLAELCLGARGFRVEFLGRRVPTDELLARLEDDPPQLLGLTSASGILTRGVLAKQAKRLATACLASGTLLVLGGGGDWPDKLQGARRVRTLDELDQILGELRSSHAGSSGWRSQ